MDVGCDDLEWQRVWQQSWQTLELPGLKRCHEKPTDERSATQQAMP